MKLLNKNVYTGLAQVAQFSERSLPIKVAYAVGKSLVPLREQFDVIEDLRQKVIKQYAVIDKDGKRVKKEDGTPELKDEDKADEKLKELGLLECQVAVHKMDEAKFLELMEKEECSECKNGTATVSPNEMAALIKLGILV